MEQIVSVTSTFENIYANLNGETIEKLKTLNVDEIQLLYNKYKELYMSTIYFEVFCETLPKTKENILSTMAELFKIIDMLKTT